MALLKMMMATGARQMKIVAVGLVRFELSLNTLLMVIGNKIVFRYAKFAIIDFFVNSFQILKTTYSIVMLIKSI